MHNADMTGPATVFFLFFLAAIIFLVVLFVAPIPGARCYPELVRLLAELANRAAMDTVRTTP